MTIARKHQISLECTPYYHCVSRCVRRAFLCGKDSYTGKSFEHRRRWIEQRILFLAKVFAIDICAYAVMSNHYHLVVRLAPDKAKGWSEAAVLQRWGQVFSVPPYVSECADEVGLQRAEFTETINMYRQRLTSLSWFMRCINEPLARRSNQEDCCTGRFWEGRFKVQALLDETALIRCMAYVDLNPIRSKIAVTPETSAHTSVSTRIRGGSESLLAFRGNRSESALPYHWEDYLLLVEWTGRQWHREKRGRIDPDRPIIFKQMNIEAGQWLEELRRTTSRTGRALGSIESLQNYCNYLGQRRLKGLDHFISPTDAAVILS